MSGTSIPLVAGIADDVISDFWSALQDGSLEFPRLDIREPSKLRVPLWSPITSTLKKAYAFAIGRSFERTGTANHPGNRPVPGEIVKLRMRIVSDLSLKSSSKDAQMVALRLRACERARRKIEGELDRYRNAYPWLESYRPPEGFQVDQFDDW